MKQVPKAELRVRALRGWLTRAVQAAQPGAVAFRARALSRGLEARARQFRPGSVSRALLEDQRDAARRLFTTGAKVEVPQRPLREIRRDLGQLTTAELRGRKLDEFAERLGGRDSRRHPWPPNFPSRTLESERSEDYWRRRGVRARSVLGLKIIRRDGSEIWVPAPRRGFRDWRTIVTKMWRWYDRGAVALPVVRA